jgi:hypothetical protein
MNKQLDKLSNDEIRNLLRAAGHGEKLIEEIGDVEFNCRCDEGYLYFPLDEEVREGVVIAVYLDGNAVKARVIYD